METKSIDDLKPDPRNPRTLSKHDGNALSNSIKHFGDLSCIVFNTRTGQLVGGHQRIEIMKRLSGEKRIAITQRFDAPDTDGTVAIGYVFIGNKQFAYREVDWNINTQRAANIAANRIQGEFNLEMLAEIDYELSQLENGAELLALTGQDENELADILKVSGLADDDREPKEPTMTLRIECDTDIQMNELYQELKGRGLNVKI